MFVASSLFYFFRRNVNVGRVNCWLEPASRVCLISLQISIIVKQEHLQTTHTLFLCIQMAQTYENYVYVNSNECLKKSYCHSNYGYFFVFDVF